MTTQELLENAGVTLDGFAVEYFEDADHVARLLNGSARFCVSAGYYEVFVRDADDFEIAYVLDDPTNDSAESLADFLENRFGEVLSGLGKCRDFHFTLEQFDGLKRNLLNFCAEA